MSKSLTELAEDYLTEAERIKKKIAELEAKGDCGNRELYNHILSAEKLLQQVGIAFAIYVI